MFVHDTSVFTAHVQGALPSFVEELLVRWPQIAPSERVSVFKALPEGTDDHLFLSLSSEAQAQLLSSLPPEERRMWLRALAPDDAVDVLQVIEPSERPAWLIQLDASSRREVQALLAYAEDVAGGLMSPRFARLRPEMTVGEAIRYLRKQATAGLETLYYAYVLDAGQRLLGVVSFRQLFAAPDAQPLAEVMVRDFVSVPPDMDQEQVAQIIAQHDLVAVPVLNGDGVLRGIVTVDDIVDVVHEEASEDIQKLGGMAALELPYLATGLLEMIRKRAGWLMLLFVGEMFTASAMAVYEEELSRALVLALFVPLIISSGGNSGSQATTLVIRAMALGELQLQDWWRVVRREIASGLMLGALLAALGFARIGLGEALVGGYGPHWPLIALTVAGSLVGVVTWGTVCGSMLPLLIRRLGFDPASASAPFVATLVDVSGLVIYFSIAEVLLRGTLL
jgi:magnesium transporter